MSIYRDRRSPFWQYDFRRGGHRFFGSTRQTARREAEAAERTEIAKAEALVRANRAGERRLTIEFAAGRYLLEVGQHHVNAATTARDLDRLVEWFGKDRALASIGDDDVTKLVAWRRGHRVRGRKRGPLVSAATVNRSTVQLLQAIFTRARRHWSARFDAEPNWRKHRLAEPEERVRELRADEAAALDAATRADYLPFFTFAAASGLRLNECLLRWAEVDFEAGRIVKAGKGGRRVTTPLTPAVRAILAPLRGHHPEMVFTYVAARTRRDKGHIKGRRYPITYSGAKTAWRRLRAAAKVEGFRFHDFRHDVGTKLLRATGNLKLVQKALSHRKLETTLKYAHVLDEEVAEGLARVQNSRIQSRNGKRDAG